MFSKMLKSISWDFILLFLLLITNFFTINSAVAIIGGRDARNGEFPFFAAIVLYNKEAPMGAIICGGTLIAQKWVLTSTHCLKDRALSSLRVILGIYSRSSIMPGQHTIEVDKIYSYTLPGPAEPAALDVTLIKLSEMAPLSFVPAIIDAYEQPHMGGVGTLMGFGLIHPDPRTYADRLQVIDSMPIIEFSQCNDGVHSFYSMVQFCAGYHDRPIYPQDGDSGSPFITYLGGYDFPLILGILHFGPTFGTGPGTSVYTKISFFGHWIRATICQHGGPC